MEQLFGVLCSLHRETPKHGEWVVACLEGAWPKLLGEKLAEVCRPIRFEEPELVVEIFDNNLKEALQNVKPELLKRLHAATAGAVKTLTVVGR